jgi:hypothetical protein
MTSKGCEQEKVRIDQLLMHYLMNGTPLHIPLQSLFVKDLKEWQKYFMA